jgi:hypothetical protein
MKISNDYLIHTDGKRVNASPIFLNRRIYLREGYILDLRGDDLSTKDDFAEAFQKKVGKHPRDFKTNPAGLAEALNSDNELRRLFHEAVKEATEGENATAGMGLLFGN